MPSVDMTYVVLCEIYSADSFIQSQHTNTHTQAKIYIYIYIYKSWSVSSHISINIYTGTHVSRQVSLRYWNW